jgi:hypothetical protein
MSERPVGSVVGFSPAALTGKVLAWKNNNPVFASVLDVPDSFVPVFDTPEMLHASMAERQITDYTIKQIDDGVDFVASIELGGARVMLNPRPGEGGRVRWTEVMSVEGAYERYTGHYFDADSLRLVIRSTPNVPSEIAETVIQAIEAAGAIKGDRGQYADVMECGQIMATLVHEASQPAKFFVRNIAEWINDTERLPIIKRPGDARSGSN